MVRTVFFMAGWCRVAAELTDTPGNPIETLVVDSVVVRPHDCVATMQRYGFWIRRHGSNVAVTTNSRGVYLEVHVALGDWTEAVVGVFLNGEPLPYSEWARSLRYYRFVVR